MNHIRAAAILFGALGAMAPVQAATQPVAPIRGSYCVAMGPRGWFVRAENAQRVAFGADLNSGDGQLGASYAVFAAGRLSMVPGSETPDRAVAKTITQFGQVQTRFGARVQLAPNIFLVEFLYPQSHGVAFYEVFPAGPGSWMIVMREAMTPIQQWRQRGPEAAAVARSLHCQVPNVPPAPDPPSLNRRERRASSGNDKGEDDSLYNQWLGKEYYHDPKTGENFWVSPTEDWSKSGPEGEGYYRQIGNEARKLEPGYR